MKRLRAASATAALALLIGAPSAQAQIETAPVATMPAAEISADQSLFQAKGLPIGDFRLFPSLGLDAAFDDDVFRTSLSPISDYYFLISPAVVLRSEWERHMIEFKANLDQYQYVRLDHENHTNFNVSSDGRLDLGGGLVADATIAYQDLHLERGDPNLPIQALEPTQYSDLHAIADIEQYVGPFGLRAGATFDRYDYSNTPLVGGGTFDNSFQNRDAYTAYAKADYEFSPGYAVFVQGTYDDRIYDITPDPFGFDRSSNGVAVDAGLDLQVSNLIEGNIFAGYLKQNYKAPLNSPSGVDYGASLVWYPTGLLTVHFNAQHLIEETIIPNAAAANAQLVGLNADYQFRHDIVLTAGGAYANDDFSGTARIDHVVTGTFTAKYLLNEYMFAKANFTHTDRSSTLTGFGYRDNTVMIGLGFQL